MTGMAAGQPAGTSRDNPQAQPVFGAIEQQIGLGIIAPGDAIPPERELARLFGVGRVTIQLAIGLLEADRLITTRRGRSTAGIADGPIHSTERYPPDVSYPGTWLPPHVPAAMS